MVNLDEEVQTGDWAAEKHVPAIEIVSKEEGKIDVKVMVGKEIPHPNTTAHYIEWINLFFHPDGAKFPYQIGRAEFLVHGASTDGADTSTIYCEPVAWFTFKTEVPGLLYAISMCNIHGLWRGEETLEL
jgi:superoxide reductase